jgi:hypothetical protein
VGGLLRGRPSLRHAGLGLLGLSLAKILVLDLSSLDASYRAVSFIAVGLLLLAAALAYRRLSGATADAPDLEDLEIGGDDSPESWAPSLLAGLVAVIAAIAIG